MVDHIAMRVDEDGFDSKARVATVQFSPVQGHISPNLEPDFGSGSQIFVNLNLNLREPDFRSSSGSSRVQT